jgi:hypothetical protein
VKEDVSKCDEDDGPDEKTHQKESRKLLRAGE